MHLRLAAILALAFPVTFVFDAQAQVIGTFRWQTQPYCNVITVTVTQQGPLYQLIGTDNLCGAGTAPVVGTAAPGGSGVVMGLTASLPSGRAAHLSATISLATVSGTWADGDGNTGPFAFGAATAGAARPAPAAATAITVAQFSSSVYAGTGAASTLARSDHLHDDRYYTRAQTDAARTVSLSLPIGAMRWAGATVPFTYNGCASRPSGGAFVGLLPFSLPTGATLTGITAFLLDGSVPQYSVTVTRGRLSGIFLASSTLATVTGGDAVISLDTVALPITPTLVQAADSFELQFIAGAEFANGFCGATVTYTLAPV